MPRRLLRDGNRRGRLAYLGEAEADDDGVDRDFDEWASNANGGCPAPAASA